MQNKRAPVSWKTSLFTSETICKLSAYADGGARLRRPLSPKRISVSDRTPRLDQLSMTGCLSPSYRPGPRPDRRRPRPVPAHGPPPPPPAVRAAAASGNQQCSGRTPLHEMTSAPPAGRVKLAPLGEKTAAHPAGAGPDSCSGSDSGSSSSSSSGSGSGPSPARQTGVNCLRQGGRAVAGRTGRFRRNVLMGRPGRRLVCAGPV